MVTCVAGFHGTTVRVFRNDNEMLDKMTWMKKAIKSYSGG